ncbi:MAG: MetQ/NlpA family ABC transporter substrate-binding protein [Lachnospiraceae bacterium]
MRTHTIQLKILLSVLLLTLSAGCGKKDNASDQELTKQTAETEEGRTEEEKRQIHITYALPKAGEAALTDKVVGNDMDVTNDEEAQLPVKGTVRVAAVGSLDRELLEAAAPILRQQGYVLEPVSCEDYESPNTMVQAGEVQANLFQHAAYLERYNQEKDTNLVNAGAVYYEPMGIYAGKTVSLDELQQGSRIGVPLNPTGYARALLLLRQEGLLELVQDVDLLAVWEDVTANPYGLELVQMEESELVNSRNELDLVLVTTGYFLEAGLEPGQYLALEAKDSMAATELSRILAIREEAAGEEGIILLLQALHSLEIKEFISTQYEASIIIQD